jgi:hypothetical protein
VKNLENDAMKSSGLFAFLFASKSALARSPSRWRAAVLVGATLSAVGASSPASASAIYNVSFDDPTGQYSAYYERIVAGIQAAGAAWSNYVTGAGSIDVAVRFADIPTMTGWSATSAYVGTNGPYSLWEQGVASELRTGVDYNGAAPDAIVTIGGGYLVNNLWFDPAPNVRTAPVPSDKTDAESAFIHELGHMLAFNGWRDPVTGALPGQYESTFDRYAAAMNGNLYFTGPDAEAQYGGPVPLTSGDYQHFGNAAGPGAELIDDLMNGVTFYDGTRYSISPLDLAVLADAGVPLAAGSDVSFPLIASGAGPAAAPSDIPEPPSLALMLSAILALILARRARPAGHVSRGSG